MQHRKREIQQPGAVLKSENKTQLNENCSLELKLLTFPVLDMG